MYFPPGSVPVEVSEEHGLVLAAALKISSMEVLFCPNNLLGYVTDTFYARSGFFSYPGPSSSEKYSYVTYIYI